jgi:hypothetical protein
MTDHDPKNTGLCGALDDVNAFHEAMAEAYPEGAECLGRPGLTRRWSRLKWIREEVDELEEAIEANDVAAALDALLDIIYFCIGTGIMWVGRRRMARAWLEVHRTNMDKRGRNGQTKVRASDGKIQKPDGWVGPRIEAIIEAIIEGDA